MMNQKRTQDRLKSGFDGEFFAGESSSAKAGLGRVAHPKVNLFQSNFKLEDALHGGYENVYNSSNNNNNNNNEFRASGVKRRLDHLSTNLGFGDPTNYEDSSSQRFHFYNDSQAGGGGAPHNKPVDPDYYPSYQQKSYESRNYNAARSSDPILEVVRGWVLILECYNFKRNIL